jgi:hypothetical protein
MDRHRVRGPPDLHPARQCPTGGRPDRPWRPDAAGGRHRSPAGHRPTGRRGAGAQPRGAAGGGVPGAVRGQPAGRRRRRAGRQGRRLAARQGRRAADRVRRGPGRVRGTRGRGHHRYPGQHVESDARAAHRRPRVPDRGGQGGHGAAAGRGGRAVQPAAVRRRLHGRRGDDRPRLPGARARGAGPPRRREELSIGYQSHDADTVELYFQESFTFLVQTAEAGVAIG